MDIGVTISKVRKEYKEYLRETHPDWADTTISTHVSDAFYLYQNTIALSFWKCFESDAAMEKAKGEILDYLKQEVMSDRADERTAQYYRDLKRLKEFIDSKGGVKTYIGYEYDCEVIVYKYAKMVYDGTMEMDAAVKAMCQDVPCFGETSHKLTIMLFASMMKGVKYTRRSNTETISPNIAKSQMRGVISKEVFMSLLRAAKRLLSLSIAKTLIPTSCVLP